jgi:hypothetical protein
MKRPRVAILLLSATVAVQGCGIDDPDQPKPGSISISAKKPDSGLTVPAKKTSTAKTSK